MLCLPSSIPSLTATQDESLRGATDMASLSSSVHAKLTISILQVYNDPCIHLPLYESPSASLRSTSKSDSSESSTPSSQEKPKWASNSSLSAKISSRALPLVVEAIWHGRGSRDSCMHARFAAKAEAQDSVFTWKLSWCCINFDFLFRQ